jgi:hypothetical protein
MVRPRLAQVRHRAAELGAYHVEAVDGPVVSGGGVAGGGVEPLELATELRDLGALVGDP